MRSRLSSSNHWFFDGLICDPSYFDPNDSRYRCCCNQCHAATGVRVIAGLIGVTVLMEFWSLGWYLFSGTSNSDGIISSVFQLFVGLILSGTIIYALWREHAAFLLPYLLLQTVGLATGFVILFALIYVTIDDDVSTIKAFFDSHGTNVVFNDDVDTKQPIRYVGWMMVGSCIVVIALQIWLISIVFACWRFFRDKKAYGFSKGYNSYIVLRPPFLSYDQTHFQNDDKAIFRKILRSVSADDLYYYNRASTRFRSHSTFVDTLSTNSSSNNNAVANNLNTINNYPKISSVSFDCSTKKTMFLA